MVMFVQHILGGWGSALETNNTPHKSLSQAHKTFGIVCSDVAQDTIPFSACVQNLLTKDSGSCKESEETYCVENLSKERSPLRWVTRPILPHITFVYQAHVYHKTKKSHNFQRYIDPCMVVFVRNSSFSSSNLCPSIVVSTTMTRRSSPRNLRTYSSGLDSGGIQFFGWPATPRGVKG